MTADIKKDGRTRRSEAMSRLETARAEWLKEARDFAVKHCKEHGTVTSDDVRKGVPFPVGVDARVMGAVFKGSTFRPVDWAITEIPSSHGRPIRVWELAEQ